MWGLLFDYYATAKGFEVRLFGLILVYRLKRDNIVAAHIIDGMFNFSEVIRLGSHPWNSVAMANRWRRKWVLLEKRWWPRFLSVTPKNAHEFVATLNLSPSESRPGTYITSKGQTERD
jgi:hypothetical protein